MAQYPSQSDNVAMTDQIRRLPKIFDSVRSRVLLGCILLMSFSGLVSTIFIRELLYVHLEDRIEKELQRVSGEFVNHTQSKKLEIGQSAPKTPVALFESFIGREVIKEKYYLLIVDGRIYQTSNRRLTDNFHLDPARLDRLSKLTTSESEEIEIGPNSIIYCNAIALDLPTGQKGVFVALFDATGECEEITQAMAIIIGVTLAVLLISSIAALIDTKRILQPLQLLTNTARSISNTDLSERIPVRGRNEIAELTITFNEMLDRLQTTFNNQKEFFNHAGHELRTPLTIIRVNLEMMGTDPLEQQQTIALVTDELDRMSRYVNDMILLAKSEQPDFLILETVSLSDLTEEIYTKATALGKRHWQLQSVGTGHIVCDRHRITQVVMNLAQNATQQTKIGDRIVIGSTMKNGSARFWVRDYGAGIDPRVHEIIFDRFIRCPDARRRFEGMGLGLAIVKSIVEAHGGRIKLASEMNRGSKFTVVIPIDPPREIPQASA
jgi:signal transduction histidine kinase